MRESDGQGPSQTFPTLPFSMAPEDVDAEIETDERVHDITRIVNTVHDLQRQVRERDETVREQTQMLRERDETVREQTQKLRERDETVREQEQTIQMLLAREQRYKAQNLCVVQ